MPDLGDFTTIDIDGRELRNNPDFESIFYDLDYSLNVVENMENHYPYDFVQGDVGIERKRLDDFMKSIRASRTDKHSIWDQCNRMIASGMHSYIIIEGDLNEYLYSSRVTTTQFYGAMGSIAVRYNIHPMWVHDMEHFGYLAGKIFKSHRQGKHGMGRHNRATYVDPDLSIAAQILSLCGIDKKAVLIAEKLCLTDIMDIITLNTSQLRSIPTVGPTIAENIISKLGIRSDP